jgi:hypothetical protein
VGLFDEGGGWAGGILRQIGPYIGGALEGLIPGQKQKGRPPVAAGPTMGDLANPLSDFYTHPPWLGGTVYTPPYQQSSPVLTVTPVPPMRTTEVGPTPKSIEEVPRIPRTMEGAPISPYPAEGSKMGGFEGFGLSLPVPTSGEYGFDWGSAIDWGFDIYDKWKARSSPPGPRMAPPQLPQLPGGTQVPGPYTAGPPYAQLPPYAGPSAVTAAPPSGGACMSGFRVMPQHTRALRMIEARSPTTGKMHYWKHMGTPILFSGDLANCKRVGKVQARLNRARPRKR